MHIDRTEMHLILMTGLRGQGDTPFPLIAAKVAIQPSLLFHYGSGFTLLRECAGLLPLVRFLARGKALR